MIERNVKHRDGPAGPGSGQDKTGQESPAEGSVRISASDRRWRDLLDLDARLGKAKGIRLLTPEARVLLHLTLSGPVPVTSLMEAAGTSYRGFYAVIERLKQAGLVAATRDAQDQRVRRLELDPSLRLPSSDR